ncbi:hypothetical protein D3Y59_03975 [Hymenobacter oligotrophus]|uniref:Uncharacterized protein n=1 Tax=Hymenobacter oligotrophus TaxID=2319843 RepID=A0A3B7QWV4_9BACT|nr:hypothetical protein [Hymenobacter oligotrophus]AYA36294.1 hypothetical protein D3Y59_03975 [Hymenobacter oligotrophus]
MEKEVVAVRDLIVQQAKHFLTEAGAFYPFGALLKTDGSLALIGIEDAEDVEPAKMVERLERQVWEQLAGGEALVGGIGVDLILRFSAETAPTDAVHIRLLAHYGYAIDYFITYRLAEDRLICDPLFDNEGTLTLE